MAGPPRGLSIRTVCEGQPSLTSALGVMTAVEPRAKRPPVLGVLSILLPCVGCGLFFAIARSAKQTGDLGDLFGGYGLWIASTLFSILAAVIAWLRGERCRLLPLLGVLLSLGPVILGLVLLMHR